MPGNIQDADFRVTSDQVIGKREKRDRTSVYLNVSGFEGTVRVRVLGFDRAGNAHNCTWGGGEFHVSAGKYFLYNNVGEEGYPHAALQFLGVNGRTITGRWSPDSVPESGCITLKRGQAVGGVPHERSIPFRQRDSRHEGVRTSGCLFCCDCWLAGANNITEVDNAFDWAVDQGLVRRSDSYVQREQAHIVPRLLQYFGRPGRNGEVTWHDNHAHLRHGGIEVYNSVDWGYKSW